LQINACRELRETQCAPPAYCWSAEISALRKLCISHKRAYQPKRNKRSESECETEAEEYKLSRKNLVTEIRKAKEKCWRKLCQEVDKDPWGRPFKIAMKKLGRRKPILGADVPGRIERIIQHLFPANEEGDNQEIFDPDQTGSVHVL